MTTPESPVPVKVEARHLIFADKWRNRTDLQHQELARDFATSEAAATAELRAELERTRLALKDACEVIVTIQANLAASAPPPAQEQKP